MARKLGQNIALPSSILLVFLFLVSLLIGCVLAPLVDLVIDKLLLITCDERSIVVHTALAAFFILCLFFRNSLKSNVKASLNLPFFTVLSHFFMGVAVGIILVGLALVVVVAFRARGVDFNTTAAPWMPVLLALWIGVFEEVMHRGFVFQSLRQELTTFPAIILSSALYSLLHFTHARPPVFSSSEAFDMFLGFKAFPHLFDGFRHVSTILPEITGCFLLGVLFCLAYTRRGSLYVPIGLHALLVFVEQSRIVTIRPRFLGGSQMIFGSHGAVLEAFLGSITAWILLLLAIIYFLSTAGLSWDTSEKKNR
jgi:membrane protease YdiL (CAAX protease family)